MSVARSYAQALYESISGAGNQVAQVEKDLIALVEMTSAVQDLKWVLEGSVVSADEKNSVLDALQKQGMISADILPFLKLLIRKQRMSELVAIQEQFSAVKLEYEGGVLGEVVSAESLSLEDLQSLEQVFSKKLGKKVIFRSKVDPLLLGGMKVQVNGVTYDGTLKTQLEKVREKCFQSLNSAI